MPGRGDHYGRNRDNYGKLSTEKNPGRGKNGDYFDKIKTFGDVPWYEKDLTTADIDELYKARDDRDFVLGKIIEDLEFAIEWLPEKSAAEVGALHKDAARTFLARVCLHYGTYKKYHNVSTSPTSQELLQKAATLAKEVMDLSLIHI